MLKISDFYLDKQKSCTPKKNMKCTMYHGLFFLQPIDGILSPNSPSIYGTGLNSSKMSLAIFDQAVQWA